MINQFIQDVFDSAVKHVVKLTVFGIFGSIYFIGAPYWFWMTSWLSEAENITTERALALARQSIGSKVQFAIPFRNLDNPNQFIAVWSTHDPVKPDNCLLLNDGSSVDDDEISSEDCPHGMGLAKATLLIGNGEIFEKIETYQYSFNISGVPPGAVDGYTPAHYQKNFGVTDWNNDGKKEILSIASDGTPSTVVDNYQISIFDTGDMTGTKLNIRINNVESSQELVPKSADRGLRDWLFTRFEEFTKANLSTTCERALDGTLSCKFPKGDDEFEPSQETIRIRNLTHRLHSAWIQRHGSTFTTGKLKLEYLSGTVAETDENGFCEIDDGEKIFINAFKGPLIMVDSVKQQSVALYVPDGQHGRELPNVIVGKDYLWLSAFLDNRLIAIRKSNYEVISVDVAEWEKSVPIRSAEIEDSSVELELVQSYKEEYLDLLILKGSQLTFLEEGLQLSIDGVNVINSLEFADAMQCEDHM